ncbi:MAG: metallophosphoesterase [Acidobacteriaceae bacterium]
MSLFRVCRMLAFLLGCGASVGCVALRAAPVEPMATVPVVMLSDLHFDPYHDPAKFERLRSAPASEWQKILAGPDAEDQAGGFAKLLKACRTRGVDTPWTLLESSLTAAHAQSPHALFVTVAGDLLAHQFDCRFHVLAPGAAESEYSAFAAKTVSYVASELHRAFPETPVYLALGNNDSGCGDYREAVDSGFLHNIAESFGDDVGSVEGRKELLHVFPMSGNYSVALPRPIVRGRLIVLQDIFLSVGYAGCDGKPDAVPGAAELEWLRTELTAARARHEQVWVMAHIPPGVNLYSTVATNRDVCGGQAPVMFLRNEKLAEVLTDFAADIRLVIFGHTHNDEMRLLQGVAVPSTANAKPAPARVVAKLVPSVTPVNGNYPAFTLADVDPRTAVMKDYRVIAADNQTGINAKWAEEYRYSTTYRSAAFTPGEVVSLIAKFGADKEGATPRSLAYEQNFMVNGGLRALAMRTVWPQYVCSMLNDTEAGYRSCACAAKP